MDLRVATATKVNCSHSLAPYPVDQDPW